MPLIICMIIGFCLGVLAIYFLGLHRGFGLFVALSIPASASAELAKSVHVLMSSGSSLATDAGYATAGTPVARVESVYVPVVVGGKGLIGSVVKAGTNTGTAPYFYWTCTVEIDVKHSPPRATVNGHEFFQSPSSIAGFVNDGCSVYDTPRWGVDSEGSTEPSDVISDPAAKWTFSSGYTVGGSKNTTLIGYVEIAGPGGLPSADVVVQTVAATQPATTQPSEDDATDYQDRMPWAGDAARPIQTDRDDPSETPGIVERVREHATTRPIQLSVLNDFAGVLESAARIEDAQFAGKLQLLGAEFGFGAGSFEYGIGNVDGSARWVPSEAMLGGPYETIAALVTIWTAIKAGGGGAISAGGVSIDAGWANAIRPAWVWGRIIATGIMCFVFFWRCFSLLLWGLGMSNTKAVDVVADAADGGAQ